MVVKSKKDIKEHPIRIGVSSCLLGLKVRFDGGHKHDSYLTNTLGEFFQWVPVCPEVEIGMGIPRESISLRKQGDAVKLLGNKSAHDYTAKMLAYSRKKVENLVDLDGYLLKKDSPSCGLERVKVHPGGGSSKEGRGLFSQVLLERFPNLPVEEEGRLCDPRLRENWIERVLVYHGLRQLWAGDWRLKDLIEFHSRHKLAFLAHSPEEYRQMGRLVGTAKPLPRNELRGQYEYLCMSALKKISTPRKHTNVLMHMLGYFKKILNPEARGALLASIEDYLHGIVPLVVPVTLLAHYVRLLDVSYLKDQSYLNPHPKELALRNHV